MGQHDAFDLRDQPVLFVQRQITARADIDDGLFRL
jgi:hypothetical protein